MADDEPSEPSIKTLAISGVPIEIIKWIFNQGLAIILLFAVLYALYTEAPKQLDKIEDGFKRVQNDAASERKEIMERFDKTLVSLEANRKEEADRHTKNFERVSTSIDKLTDLFKSIIDRIDRPFAKPVTPPTTGTSLEDRIE